MFVRRSCTKGRNADLKNRLAETSERFHQDLQQAQELGRAVLIVGASTERVGSV